MCGASLVASGTGINNTHVVIEVHGGRGPTERHQIDGKDRYDSEWRANRFFFQRKIVHVHVLVLYSTTRTCSVNEETSLTGERILGTWDPLT